MEDGYTVFSSVCQSVFTKYMTLTFDLVLKINNNRNRLSGLWFKIQGVNMKDNKIKILSLIFFV